MNITTADLVGFLVNVPGFSDLTRDDLEHKIVPIIGVCSYKAGETIIKRGDGATTLFVIYQGSVKGETRGVGGGEEYQFCIHAGHAFGESALVSNQLSNSTITAAADPTVCLTMDIDSCQQIMIRDWRFTKSFTVLIGQRMVDRLLKEEVAKFKWSDKYRIGIALIDDQHQRLFAVINQLGDFLENRHESKQKQQQWSVQNFLVEISDYSEKHFAAEERVMEKVAAPMLAEHKKIHQGLLENIVGFKNRILANANISEQLQILEQIHKFMGSWLIKHIMEEDVKFIDYYRANQKP